MSFGGNTPQYIMKLVYLPDLTRPMAMKISTGLFGTSSMKPVFQSGWMLTSLDVTADSKAAETLTALGSIVGAVVGMSAGGAPAATGAAKKKAAAPGGGASRVPVDLSGLFAPGHYILKPGLYKFNYDTGPNGNGALTGLLPVTYFTGCGPIQASDPAALAKADTGENCFEQSSGTLPIPPNTH
jgi:hypothetical protein